MKADQKTLLTTGSAHSVHHAYSNPGFTQSQSLPDITRVSPPRNPKRALKKNGDFNIHHLHITKLATRYLRDLFTSLVDLQWRWTLISFALAHYISWLLFALIWWLIMFTHGDLEDEHLPQNQAENNWTPCVLNIHNYTSCFLYSLETQSTIGYGVRTITEECPEAIFMLSMQAMIGMTIDAFFIGIVFAKMTRPKLRTQTILFSRNAVICKQDGKLCFMFRVGDMRKSPLIGASIRAQMLKPIKTKEGENLKNYIFELELNIDGCGNDVILLWPVTVRHIIERESPLFEFTAQELLNAGVEILVVLEGTVESTGQSIQARTSYLSTEILWGYNFEPVVDHLKREDAYDVNYSKFDQVYPVDVATSAASELEGAQSPETARVSSSSSEDDGSESVPRRPPAPRRRSFVKATRGSNAFEEDSLIQFTTSYV